MSTETREPTTDDHGFEIRKRRRWPFVAGGAVVLLGAAAAIVVPRLGGDTTANTQAGATLYVATAEGNAREEALIEYIAKDVAPAHGITVAFKALADSNTINRAVSDGEVAGTIYQHKLWLGQVLQANPDFREEAATPVFRWGSACGRRSGRARRTSRTAGRSRCTPTPPTSRRGCSSWRRPGSSR